MIACEHIKTPAGFRDFLVGNGRLTDQSGQRLLSAMDATGHPIDTVATELGLMREEALAQALADYLETDFEEKPAVAADLELALDLGLNYLGACGAVPLLESNDDTLVVAAANPFDETMRAMLGYKAERRVVVKTTTRSAAAAWVSAVQREADERSETESHAPAGAAESDLERLRELAQQAPVVRLVAQFVLQAVDEGATDIHFEPFEHDARLRFRVDGMLTVADIVPRELVSGVISRIKILSGLDISERRLPQDGRMRLAVRGQEIDLRVSTTPAIHGETIVLRLLDRSAVALDLYDLGFGSAAVARLEQLAGLPNGIVLVTGPTGSGKTTTLYAMIGKLNDPSVKIFTVEDPVEYRMAGIVQLQVNTATGLTFARTLRSVLRQDPDIILIGEIRDRETAEIAMQAALTGHLVFSTLHTNSAAGAVTRLRDMGIESYLIGSTVKGIAAQRLVRKICVCSGDQACLLCHGTGYHGRTVCYEIGTINETLGSDISSGADEAAIDKALRRAGMVPLHLQAQELTERAVTSRAEIARVLALGEDELA